MSYRKVDLKGCDTNVKNSPEEPIHSLAHISPMIKHIKWWCIMMMQISYPACWTCEIYCSQGQCNEM